VPVVCGVDFGKVLPFLRCGHGACRYAGAAIDTFNRINVQLQIRPKCRFVLPRVNTIYRAGVHTGW
jgi:hypothetical protein